MKRTKKNGAFAGFINDAEIVKGIWSSPNEKKYPFYLTDSKMNLRNY
jgi:hypothetical protein